MKAAILSWQIVLPTMRMRTMVMIYHGDDADAAAPDCDDADAAAPDF